MAAMWSPIIGLLLLLLPLAPTSSIMYPLEGRVYPEGHFAVKMYIGEPLTPYYLDIDTGSNLTWLECHHPVYRSRCTPGVKDVYKPKPANLKVDCKDLLCAALHADLPGKNPVCRKGEPHTCHYGVEYVDSLTTQGVLANDTVSVGQGKNIHILFGCGYEQKLKLKKPNPKPLQGLLGLGMGKVGFVAQLKEHQVITKNVIGHCLSLSVNGGGYLFIGDYDKLPASITWAPMKKYGLHYSPGQATLHFQGQQIYANGMSVVFDSGSTYTYVPAQIYTPLVEKVRASLDKVLDPVFNPALPYCWTPRGPGKKEFDSLTLQFDNKIVMTISYQNYLIRVGGMTVCLGILNGSKEGQNQRIIIGDVTMLDMLVVYDNEQGRIGWVKQDCKSATTSRL